VDKGVAKYRALKREQEEGRSMPEEILIEYRSRFSALWPYYLDIVDEASLYETSTEEPILIFSSKKGLFDLETYQKFLQDGEPFYDFFSKKLSAHR
jgi:predicted ABC-type ATPase